ncbi:MULTISPECIES: Gfo/Idh/MocA family protein [Paenibacillus]|uniref:Gfo/Idh/MocA family protein n=1 Tax=Paenibacillus TaxID=44249 RepID=UPI0022B86AC9|nr:Gfo/Idh/MocA family oxidoreductase [Paenibacillus caseinilyticus]MCZ8518263.1 Gfo/Idh/MocA family oxidoreductase [Paenibacillus caseinilyticus]
MLKIGLIGLGFMGRTHLENYLRLEAEGLDIRVAAVCDADPEKLQGQGTAGNIGTAGEEIDLGRFARYSSITDMLELEELDAVDITLPTYLHAEVSVQCLEKGLHVLCEKPMAMHAGECEEMVRAAEHCGRQLLVGQCLRFWPAYVYLKEVIDSRVYGEVISGSFFRGGATPTWGPWLMQKEKSGGALMDMHVHDTDAIHWLFGKPRAVSCLGKNVVPGSGYDTVSTNYAYDDGKVIHAGADWTLGGDFGFEMSYRVNLEGGNLVFRNDAVQVNPQGAKGFTAELSPEMGYYLELQYFVETLLRGEPVARAAGSEVKGTIEIVEAELASADRGGAWVEVE